MKIPFWNRPETRAADYSDAIVQALLSSASGEVQEGLTGAVEIAAGFWQRSFSSALIKGSDLIGEALAPHLGYIGRSLVEHGEAIFYPDFTGGLLLLPASSSIVTGGPEPASWRYELTLSGPTSVKTRRRLTAESVLHLYYVRGARNPWKGISPIAGAATTRKLLDNLERRLAQEVGGAVGSLIPVPNIEVSGQLQTDIRALKGQTTLVQSTAAGWDAGQTGAPPADFPIRRVGADPPATLPELRRDAERSVLAACGVPTDVLQGGDAAGQREGYRRFLHSTVQPVMDGVGAQVSAFFGTPIRFDRSKMFAGDLSGRARSFQSLVNGGMDITKAASLAGLMEPQE